METPLYRERSEHLDDESQSPPRAESCFHLGLRIDRPTAPLPISTRAKTVGQTRELTLEATPYMVASPPLLPEVSEQGGTDVVFSAQTVPSPGLEEMHFLRRPVRHNLSDTDLARSEDAVRSVGYSDSEVLLPELNRRAPKRERCDLTIGLLALCGMVVTPFVPKFRACTSCSTDGTDRARQKR